MSGVTAFRIWSTLLHFTGVLKSNSPPSGRKKKSGHHQDQSRLPFASKSQRRLQKQNKYSTRWVKNLISHRQHRQFGFVNISFIWRAYIEDYKTYWAAYSISKHHACTSNLTTALKCRYDFMFGNITGILHRESHVRIYCDNLQYAYQNMHFLNMWNWIKPGVHLHAEKAKRWYWKKERKKERKKRKKERQKITGTVIHTQILDDDVCLNDAVVLKVLCIRWFGNIVIVNNIKLTKISTPWVPSSYVANSVSWIWLLPISLDLGSFSSSMLIQDLLS